ncbi:oxidoreductase NAD-binding domain-containing protein 1 isoform X3 [Bos indicus x Bos taurus]|uniref:oxidoreductase NAD-binding domain-containing protein 1 isoform X3 n=1 Tax=Bos indicus x Bos taurus TaxID=30522 RepID=UPI000F7D3E4A|nr:oxidoreductase NAD-binding domain-containing protein 1 isoform X3 [Bos indicus x Bos taurus]
MVVVIPRLLRGSLGAICTQAAPLRSTPSALRYLTRSSVMKSKRRPDHLERTADVVRQEIFLHIQTTEGLIHQPEGVHGLGNKGSSPVTSVVSAAKVCGVASESPSVKRLRLLVADKDFSFKAGQWVDFFIPGVSVVGGFSICSSPRLLEQERMIELAVKHANHPPALWIHNQHAADLLRERASKGQGYEMGTVRLLYSAKDTSELLFKKNILDLVNEFPEQIACSLHVTKQTTQITADLRPYITEGRITQKEIRDHISKETLFYICGPPPMTDFFSKELESSRVPREHICFEKWW